jgi:phage-related protein
MQLKIENINTQLLLPGWTLTIGQYKRRLGVSQRYGREGAKITGDRKVSSRTLTLQKDFGTSNDDDYNDLIESVHGIFYDDYSPFYLVDTDRQVRANIELDSINPTWTKGLEKRKTSIQLQFIMIDSYFENYNVSTENWANAADSDTYLVTNIGAVDAFPIITITAQGDNFEFTILNQRTEGLITIGTNAFVLGTTIEIDCQNGTIYLDDTITRTEISHAIADGTGFFWFDLGDNTLEYQSIYGNADIVIEYRPRYAF